MVGRNVYSERQSFASSKMKNATMNRFFINHHSAVIILTKRFEWIREKKEVANEFNEFIFENYLSVSLPLFDHTLCVCVCLLFSALFDFVVFFSLSSCLSGEPICFVRYMFSNYISIVNLRFMLFICCLEITENGLFEIVFLISDSTLFQ